MQLLQQLSEQADLYQQVVELGYLLRQAKPFFDQLGNNTDSWAFRGLRQGSVPTTLAGTMEPRKGRLPVDTPMIIHRMLDEQLEREFGVRYRSDATFVTGSSMHAGDYGTLCLIFPQGPFEAVYGKNVGDAYQKFRIHKLVRYILEHAEPLGLDVTGMPKSPTTRGEEDNAMKWIDAHPDVQPLIKEWFDETYKSCDYQRVTDLGSALESSKEIMIHCDKIAVVPCKRNIHPDIIPMVERYLNVRLNFDGGENGTPDTMGLIRMMVPHLFK